MAGPEGALSTRQLWSAMGVPRPRPVALYSRCPVPLGARQRLSRAHGRQAGQGRGKLDGGEESWGREG